MLRLLMICSNLMYGTVADGESEGYTSCIHLKPVLGHVIGGHSHSCFRRRPMSFEGCRLLLGKFDLPNADSPSLQLYDMCI